MKRVAWNIRPRGPRYSKPCPGLKIILKTVPEISVSRCVYVWGGARSVYIISLRNSDERSFGGSNFILYRARVTSYGRIKQFLIHTYICAWFAVNFFALPFLCPWTMHVIVGLFVPLVLILVGGKRCAADTTITLGENEILLIFMLLHAHYNMILYYDLWYERMRIVWIPT